MITGAGSGIGRATAKIFAREGARLVLADVVGDAGLQTLAMVSDGGRAAVFIKADVSNPGEVEAAVSSLGWCGVQSDSRSRAVGSP